MFSEPYFGASQQAFIHPQQLSQPPPPHLRQQAASIPFVEQNPQVPQQKTPSSVRQGTAVPPTANDGIAVSAPSGLIESTKNATAVQTADIKGEEQPLNETKTALLLGACYAPLFALFLLMFTEIGYGASVFKGLVFRADWSKSVGTVGVSLLLVLYVFDFSRWHRSITLNFLKFLGLVIVGTSVSISVSLTFQTRPYAPILAFFAGNVMFFVMIYRHFYLHQRLAPYLHALSLALLFWGAVWMVVALIWAGVNDFWGGVESQSEFRDRLRVCESMEVEGPWCNSYGASGVRCPAGCPEVASESACPPGEESCLAALLLWSGPFVVSIASLFTGAGIWWLVMNRNEGGNDDERNAKVFLNFVIFFVFVIWIAACVAGANMEISNLISAFGVLGFIAIFATLASLVQVMGAAEEEEEEQTGVQRTGVASLLQRMMRIQNSDWLRAFFLLTLGALLPCFLALSYLNQRIRKALSSTKAPENALGRLASSADAKKARAGGARGSLTIFGGEDRFASGDASARGGERGDYIGTHAVEERELQFMYWHSLTGRAMTLDEQRLVFTARSHELLNQLSRWNATSVFSKSVWLGLGYFLLQVGVSKVVTLFLAWLNLKMAWMSVTAISFAVFFLGLALFIIPLMPGLPVYIMCGVVIGAAGLREEWSFGASMVWATVVGWLCKHVSCLMQHFMIGVPLKHSRWVKSLLCVNSPTIKAMKVVMNEPGLSLDKVALMVGGPDWPTHVLAGTLGVPQLSVQLGTTPIVVPIALTVLAGGGLLKVDEGGTWVALSALFMLLAAAALGGCTLAAVLVLERAVVHDRAKIDAEPDDEETKSYEDAVAEHKRKHQHREQWANLSLAARITLIATIGLMFMSTALVSLSSDECFHPVQLTTDYRLPPFNGNVVNLVKNPLGWIALAFQGGALLLFALFKFAHYSPVAISPQQAQQAHQEPPRETSLEAPPPPSPPPGTPSPSKIEQPQQACFVYHWPSPSPSTNIANPGYSAYSTAQLPMPGFQPLPNVGRPNTDRPNMGQPNTGQPNMGQPNMGQPNMGQLNIGQPNMGQFAPAGFGQLAYPFGYTGPMVA